MFATDRIQALNVGASGITFAEFSLDKSGGMELTHFFYESLEIEPDSEADLSAYVVATLRDIVREHDIKPGPVMISISGQAVFPRYVKLPPVPNDKVLQMVEYEAEQNVPFPIDEVVWDYQLIGGDEDGLNVMLVAVKTEIVKQLTDCVESAGFDPEVVDTAPLALFNAGRNAYGADSDAIMILDIGARSTNLVFVEGSRVFSRSIPVAGNAITQEIMKEFEVDFAEAEEIKKEHGFVAFGGVYAGPDNETADRVSKIVRTIMTRLHAEVNRSINFYRSQQGGARPELVLLTGGSSVLPHTDTFFREKLKAEVEYLNPFINVTVADTLDEEEVEAGIQVLSEVVGLALRKTGECPIEINLMPKDIVARKTFRKRIPFFVMSCACLVVMTLCWWGYFNRLAGQVKAKGDQVTAEITERNRHKGGIKTAVDKREVIEKRAVSYVNLIDGRNFWTDVLSTLDQHRLEGMWYTSIKPVYQANVSRALEGIEVRGMTYTDLVRDPVEINTNFVDPLKTGLPYFKDVSLGNARFDSFTSEFVVQIRLDTKHPVVKHRKRPGSQTK